jgi:hypothetical protein
MCNVMGISKTPAFTKGDRPLFGKLNDSFAHGVSVSAMD